MIRFAVCFVIALDFVVGCLYLIDVQFVQYLSSSANGFCVASNFVWANLNILDVRLCKRTET